MNVDNEKVLKSGLVPAKDSTLIVPFIDLDIDAQGLTKNRILMLDLLANNNWKHPIYFTGGANAEEEYIWLLLFPKPPGGEARGKILEARALTSALIQKGRHVVKF